MDQTCLRHTLKTTRRCEEEYQMDPAQIPIPEYYWPVHKRRVITDRPVYCTEIRSNIAPAVGHFSVVKRCSIFDSQGRPRGEEVAIKVLVPNFSSRALSRSVSRSEEIMRKMSHRLWREREIHLNLKNDNTAPLVGFFEDSNASTWCLVTPWYRNGTVRTLANQPGYSSEKPRLLFEAGLGLSYLHSESVVHGDIKSSNVMVDEKGHARIIDFGVSYSVLGRLPDGSSCLAAAQQWMAPELHTPQYYQHVENPEIPTFKSDVWSFGCLILEMYANADPYRDIDKEKVFSRINPSNGQKLLPGDPKRYSEVRKNDTLWALCNLCWDYNVETRPSIDYVLRVLNNNASR